MYEQLPIELPSCQLVSEATEVQYSPVLAPSTQRMRYSPRSSLFAFELGSPRLVPGSGISLGLSRGNLAEFGDVSQAAHACVG